MPDYLPKYAPGRAVTRTASADVTGGRLVEVSGDGTVAHAVAGSTKWSGFASTDTKNGGDLTVFSGGIQRGLAAKAIAAGVDVYAAAGGKLTDAVTAGGKVGVSQTAALAADTTFEIQMER